jgi:hypothetical protein
MKVSPVLTVPRKRRKTVISKIHLSSQFLRVSSKGKTDSRNPNKDNPDNKLKDSASQRTVTTIDVTTTIAEAETITTTTPHNKNY